MKKYISIALLALFIVPTVAFASWWNPFSWSKNSKENINITEPTLIKQADNSDSNIETKPKDAKESKVIERIIEKPVIQKITVQDPALQAKIDSLILENSNLKAEIERLKRANESLSSEPKSTVLSEFTKKCLEAKKEILDYKEEIREVDDKYNQIYEEDMSNNPQRNPVTYKKLIDAKKLKEKASLQSKLNNALSDKQLYCD